MSCESTVNVKIIIFRSLAKSFKISQRFQDYFSDQEFHSSNFILLSNSSMKNYFLYNNFTILIYSLTKPLDVVRLVISFLHSSLKLCLNVAVCSKNAHLVIIRNLYFCVTIIPFSNSFAAVDFII